MFSDRDKYELKGLVGKTILDVFIPSNAIGNEVVLTLSDGVTVEIGFDDYGGSIDIRTDK